MCIAIPCLQNKHPCGRVRLLFLRKSGTTDTDAFLLNSTNTYESHSHIRNADRPFVYFIRNSLHLSICILNSEHKSGIAGLQSNVYIYIFIAISYTVSADRFLVAIHMDAIHIDCVRLYIEVFLETDNRNVLVCICGV